MKWLLVGLSLALGTPAFAGGDNCMADCSTVGQKCGETCKKALKKDNPDKINFCKEKCKEFENACKKDCSKGDQKGKKH